MVSTRLATVLASIQIAEAWESYVSYNGVFFAMTEKSYNFTDPKQVHWKNEQTITLEAAAARCLKHGDDCVGFYRKDKDGPGDTAFIPTTATVTATGPNADNCQGSNCTGYVYYNRSFAPVNGRVRSTYTGLCMEAVPVAEGVMKITKKECGPSSFQRWMINETAMVYDGGIGRTQIVSPAKDADWMGAELFVWDATLHTVSDVRWEYTGAGQLKMNSKWKHACAFTDIEVSGGMYLWDCDDGAAQQWSLGMMDPYGPWGGNKNSSTVNSTNKTLGTSASEKVNGKIELADSPEAGTGLCLHAAEEKDGQQLSLEKCDDATTWQMDYSLQSYGRGGYRVSSAKLSTEGKCITTPGNDRSSGQLLWLWDCTALGDEDVYYHGALSYYGQMREGTVAQVRSFVQASSSVWSCADVIGDYVAGTNMQVWDCSSLGSNANQEFVWWNVDKQVEV